MGASLDGGPPAPSGSPYTLHRPRWGVMRFGGCGQRCPCPTLHLTAGRGSSSVLDCVQYLRAFGLLMKWHELFQTVRLSRLICRDSRPWRIEFFPQPNPSPTHGESCPVHTVRKRLRHFVRSFTCPAGYGSAARLHSVLQAWAQESPGRRTQEERRKANTLSTPSRKG